MQNNATQATIARKRKAAYPMFNSAMLTALISCVLMIPLTIAMFYGAVSGPVIVAMAAVNALAVIVIATINHDVARMFKVMSATMPVIADMKDKSLVMATVSMSGFFTFLSRAMMVGMIIFMVTAHGALVWSIFEDSQNPLYSKDELEAFITVGSLFATIPLGIVPMVLAWRRVSICWAKAVFKSATTV